MLRIYLKAKFKMKINDILEYFDLVTWNLAKFQYTFHSTQVKLNLISSIRNVR